jgi:hypothetical protein
MTDRWYAVTASSSDLLSGYHLRCGFGGGGSADRWYRVASAVGGAKSSNRPQALYQLYRAMAQSTRDHLLESTFSGFSV